MQPQTEVKFDKESFNRLKRTIRNMSLGKRQVQRDNAFATNLPDEVGIQLTNSCNLRCKHCFQWSEKGFHHNYNKHIQNEDISFDVIQKILRETSEAKSNLYLWGGEPLSYNQWDVLADALEKDPRWTVFCTNAIDVEKKLDSILKISKSLAMLISLEGFENENDAIRGKGTYKKVINNINLLLDLKKKGIYKGEVSVNCVLNENMVGKFFEFAEMFEQIGVNTLYYCFPWYIPEETALKMDGHFRESFAYLNPQDENHVNSWHSYKYMFNPDLIDRLIEDLNRINSKKWNIRLRYQPALETGEVKDFIMGKEVPGQKRTKCVAITNRMNVLANGKVTACKMYPEFEVGDLNTHSVYEVWHSPEFKKVREAVSCGLMPVCSKCILLYLHGV